MVASMDKTFIAIGICVALGVTAGACAGPDPDAEWTPSELRIITSLSPPPAELPSPGNKFAGDERAAQLGQALFFDKRLSTNGEVACASCHVPEKYFTDGLRQARGVGQTGRNAPTVIGAGIFPFVFHDGRKDSLWAQALGPVEAETEHGLDRLAVAHHLHTHYLPAYTALFGPLPALEDSGRFPSHARPVDLDRSHPHQLAWAAMRPEDQDAVNRVFANFGKAIEAYERKLSAQPAPFDRYVAALKAGDASGGGQLSAAARRGLRAFIGKAGCVNCHNGPMLTDRGFHNLGLPSALGADGTVLAGIDGGRTLGAGQVKRDPFRCGQPYSDSTQCDELRFLDPHFQDFLGAFKTPSLRNVAQTAPYFHAGQAADLRAVLDFYRTLPGKAQIGHRELTLQPLPGAVDADDMIAFLQALTGPLPPGPWGKAPAGGQL